MIDTPNKHVYRVADIEVDLLRGSLRRNGESTFLREQTLQVFCYLMEHRAETVTKEDLIKNVWQGTAVTDDALVQCIVEIRKALGDDSRHPQFVKTVPKVGYRFIAPVEEIHFREITKVETEEITSVKIEEEEEVTYEPAVRGRSMLTFARSPRVLFTGALTFLLLSALGLYVYQQSMNSRRALSNVSFPRVDGRKPIAVMFFEDRSGGPELGWLREGLADMLISDLSRAPNLNILSRQQLHLLLERIGHKVGETISFDKALEIAQKTQAPVVITGAFTKIEEKIRVDVQLHNTSDSHLLAAESFVVDRPTEILTQMGLVSLKLRKQLGVIPTDQDAKPGLTDVTTKNLEAYRYYSKALEKAQALENAEAITLLEKAIALDPEFAMAHARIGYTYAVTWNFAEKARPHLEKAFKLSERLTEKDKLYISAWYAIANLDFEGAINEYRRIITEFPLDAEAYLRLGRLLQGEDRSEEAIEVVKQGLLIDPEGKHLHNLLGGIYHSLGRYEEALAAFERYVALAPEEPNARDSLGLGNQVIGRYQQAVEEYNRALALKPNFDIAIIHLANVYFQQGRYKDALAQYQKYIATVSTTHEKSRGYDSIAYLHWQQGNLNEAERVARMAVNHEKAAAMTLIMLAGERVKLSEAENILQQLFGQGRYTYRGTRTPAREVLYYQGYLNLRRGKAFEALDAFKKALEHPPLTWSIDSYEDCLGRAYLQLNQIDPATAEFERILQINPNYPLAHYHLAQAYERKGQREQARIMYQRFLQVWKDADEDVPEVIAARARLADM